MKSNGLNEKINKFDNRGNDEVFKLRNELEESKTLIDILKMEILNINKENDEMKKKMLVVLNI